MARDTGVEEQYFRSVSNINNSNNSDKKLPERRFQDSGRSRSITPDQIKPVTQPNNNNTDNNQYRDARTRYNCKQTGHVSRYCRYKKAEYKPTAQNTQTASNRPTNSTQSIRNDSTTERQTKFDDQVNVREYRSSSKSTIKTTIVRS